MKLFNLECSCICFILMQREKILGEIFKTISNKRAIHTFFFKFMQKQHRLIAIPQNNDEHLKVTDNVNFE